MKHLLTITLLFCFLHTHAQADKTPHYDTIYLCNNRWEVREWERYKIWDRVPHEEAYSHWSELVPYHVCFLERKIVTTVIWERLN